jgi:RNA polymerase sigma factor (sigma-70 family)
MARARPPDTKPFQALYRRHYGFVWHAVRRFGVVPALTDDAVQDTFITAYRRFDEMAMPSAKAWLYGIARRVASNYRRADHRSARKRSALALAVASTPSKAAPPELVIVLERFLDSLAPVDRELFVLSEIEGMSGPEAASALALNVSTTYSRVQSLRRRFRESLAEADPRVVVRAARDERPRATAHGWALLLPELGLATATKVAPLVAWGTIAKVAALALPVAVAVGLGVTRAERAPGPQAERAAIEPRADAAIESGARATSALAIASAVPAPTPVIDVTEPAPVQTAKPRPREARAVPDAPSLERHNQLLLDAADRLREGDAAAALAITDAHAREFPKSALADARAALRIEALCAQENVAQARGEAHLFVRAHPSSPVLARVERSCAGELVESPAAGQAIDR